MFWVNGWRPVKAAPNCLTTGWFDNIIYVLNTLLIPKMSIAIQPRENTMKYLTSAMVFLLIFSLSSNLQAQTKIYTWTDKNGDLHMSEDPPPGDARLKDVSTYHEKTPQETEAIQLELEQRQATRDREEQIREAEAAQRRAVAAQEQAADAAVKAEEATQNAYDTYERYGNTRDKRKQFRKRIQRSIDEADAARTEANQSIQRAKTASPATETPQPSGQKSIKPRIKKE